MTTNRKGDEDERPPQSPARVVPGVWSYSQLAEKYDRERYETPSDVRKERSRREALLRLLPARSGRALDIACGTGRGLLVLQGHADRALGVDGTIEMLRVAHDKLSRQGLTPTLVQANAARLPFPDATFDVVTCLNFVHLFRSLDRKREFVSEAGRVLKPGGTAVVEFDSAFQGLCLGALRKHLVADIGYDWPHVIRGSFAPEIFQVRRVIGVNLPFVWRLPGLARLEAAGRLFPVNYLCNRVLVRAERRRS
jgi:ubiquinone/menaquinone biosynthesis C-methylase UbiE